MTQKKYFCCAVLIAALTVSMAAQAKTADLRFKSNTDNSYKVWHSDNGHCMDNNPMDNIGFNGLRTRISPGAITHIYYSSSFFYCAWHQSWFDFIVLDAEGHEAKIRWYKTANNNPPRLWVRSDPHKLIEDWKSEFCESMSRGGYYSTTITLGY
ncbi:hypothetical protein [Endozoicomonas sp. 4G]|uniref:hypothetical protein n=1 Tax=Endozoicomonas sp. 4G TaxID=2872754 RepID=UPI002078E195|nr:hypothetical protein [Endozoicomonas sp. 4G]